MCHKDKLVPQDPELSGHIGDHDASDVVPNAVVNVGGKVDPSEEQGLSDGVVVVDEVPPDSGAIPGQSPKVKSDPEDEEEELEHDQEYLRFRCLRCKQEAHYEHCKLCSLREI